MQTDRRVCGGRTGWATRALAVVLAAFLGVTLLAGCSSRPTAKAVGRGVIGAWPFIKAKYGVDTPMGAVQTLPGGNRSGGTPGLYGGSGRKSLCMKDKLTAFLTDPRNRGKAKAWARAQHVKVGQIESFVEKLTPVVLRNPTLVKNHDYRGGKARPYEALLEAGIAVLIDRFGQPVVKCNCGNPLAAPDHGVDDVEVDFGKSGEKTWKDPYDENKVVVVTKPSTGTPLEKVALVDVDAPDEGLERPLGTDGEADEELSEDPYADTAEEAAVPDVVGKPADEAERQLKDAGFSVERQEASAGYGDPGTVAEQHPAGGTPAEKGATVVLSVVPGEPTGEPSQSPGDEVEVPDLVGMSLDEAFAKLNELGLDPEYGPGSSQSGTAVVQETDPAAGATVVPGGTVSVTAADEEPEEQPSGEQETGGDAQGGTADGGGG